MPMGYYRKRPVVIAAIQLKATNPVEVLEFMGCDGRSFDQCGFGIDPSDGKFKIATLEGVHVVHINDWVIRGTQNEYYPCKPDIFEEIYELVGRDA